MATLNKAIEIAAIVHAGQTEKAGAPYILHPLRVMMKMTSEPAMIAAVLHDVVEDSVPGNKWTIELLRKEGFSEEVLAAVDSVTERDGAEKEIYDDFIERAGKNFIGRQVKIADIEDNMNMLRIRELRAKDIKRMRKYHRAWNKLNSVAKG